MEQILWERDCYMKNPQILKETTDFYLKDKKYYDYIIKSLSAEGYLFFSDYSTQWSKKQECHISDYIHYSEEKYFDGPDFKYFINEDGFRSKSFLEFNSNNINILFLGCSITQGVGLPDECMWTTKLVNKIKNDIPDKQIDQYNLSIAGAGIDLIVKNLITFLNTVGKPDYVFAYFPQISRSIIWDKHEYINVHYPHKHLNNYTEKEDKFGENYVTEDRLLHTTTLIHMMELICNLSGIKLVWSTWYHDQFKTIKEINFNNYFELNFNLEDHYAEVMEIHKKRGNDMRFYKNEYKNTVKRINKSNINNEPYWSSARDGWHWGTSFHTYAAEKFYEELKYKYMSSDIIDKN